MALEQMDEHRSEAQMNFDTEAVGPKHGQCFGAGYRQYGQYISLNAGKCGLSGMKYTIKYCPDQDVISLQITAPLAGSVTMRRSGCNGVLLEEQAHSEPALPAPAALQPPSWVQDILKQSTQARFCSKCNARQDRV